MNRLKKACTLTTNLVAALMMGWVVTGSAAESAVLDGWTVTAGKVATLNSTTKPKHKRVKGSFEFDSSLATPGTRLGGACLIADLTEQGVGLKSCQTDDQCNLAYDAAPNSILGPRNSSPTLSGPYLYCLGDDKNNSAKRCWIRPGHSATHCLKGPSSPTQYSVPVKVAGNPDTGSVSADPLGKGKKVSWRVGACLNPAVFPPPPGLPPCADPNSDAEVHSWGKVKKVKP